MSIFDIPGFAREIDLSNRFCSSVERQFNSKLEHYKREFETIDAEYLKIVADVKQRLEVLSVLEKINLERAGSREDFSASNRLMNLSKDVGTEKVVVDGGATTLGKGLGAGFGVGIGAVGLMTAFGTAGTGAAISGLTGAAYVSSLLAAFGGGTVASGGLSIVGGMMALGAAVAVPSLLVTGFLAHDKIKSAHKKALQRRKDAQRLQEQSNIYFADLQNGARRLREINFEFRQAGDFFGRVLNLSLTEPNIARDADYRQLLDTAAQVAKMFGELKVLDADNKLNDKFDAEVARAKKSYERCFERYIEFRTKISPQVLELNERLKNSELRPLKDEEIRAAFDEAVDSAQVELDVTAMKLNYLTEDYIPKFRALLERDVTIKIFYGIGDETSDENFGTRKTAARLKKEFGEYPNFHMRRADTHAKIFICDDKFWVLSSYNVLSKDGERYTFGEAGLRSQDAALIAHHRKEYFNF